MSLTTKVTAAASSMARSLSTAAARLQGTFPPSIRVNSVDHQQPLSNGQSNARVSVLPARVTLAASAFASRPADFPSSSTASRSVNLLARFYEQVGQPGVIPEENEPGETPTTQVRASAAETEEANGFSMEWFDFETGDTAGGGVSTDVAQLIQEEVQAVQRGYPHFGTSVTVEGATTETSSDDSATTTESQSSSSEEVMLADSAEWLFAQTPALEDTAPVITPNEAPLSDNAPVINEEDEVALSDSVGWFFNEEQATKAQPSPPTTAPSITFTPAEELETQEEEKEEDKPAATAAEAKKPNPPPPPPPPGAAPTMEQINLQVNQWRKEQEAKGKPEPSKEEPKEVKRNYKPTPASPEQAGLLAELAQAFGKQRSANAGTEKITPEQAKKELVAELKLKDKSKLTLGERMILKSAELDEEAKARGEALQQKLDAMPQAEKTAQSKGPTMKELVEQARARRQAEGFGARQHGFVPGMGPTKAAKESLAEEMKRALGAEGGFKLKSAGKKPADFGTSTDNNSKKDN